MTRRLILVRSASALLLAAVAVVLVLLARDSWHWGRAFRDADARAQVRRAGPDAWQIHSTLPSGAVRQILGVDDDLAFRRTEIRAITLAAQGATSFNLDARILVETALARLVRTDADKARASVAADYLGVLLYEDRLVPQQAISQYSGNPSGAAKQTPEQKAIAEFETAILLDPGNADAKSNLESMLEQAVPPSQQGSAKPGSGERVNNNGAGSRPAGHGY